MKRFYHHHNYDENEDCDYARKPSAARHYYGKFSSERPRTIFGPPLAALIILASLISPLIQLVVQDSSHTTSVEATFLTPKTRVCFNSMSGSFQSECVWCDSRFYASTISSCTGQATLAANITQAQAFCIATACLQQTGSDPTLLGKRRKRSAQYPFRFSFSKNISKTTTNNSTATATSASDSVSAPTKPTGYSYVMWKKNPLSMFQVTNPFGNASKDIRLTVSKNKNNNNIQANNNSGRATTSAAVSSRSTP